MIIDFKNMSEKIVEKSFGGSKQVNMKIFEDPNAKLMTNRLMPGSSVGFHQHTTSWEVYYFLSGTGTLNDNNNKIKVKPGDFHYCKLGDYHELINDGHEDLVFLALVAKYN